MCKACAFIQSNAGEGAAFGRPQPQGAEMLPHPNERRNNHDP